MRSFLKMYAVGVVTCFAIDLVWLGGIARGFYQRQLGHLLRPDVQRVPAILFYLVHVAALVDLARGAFLSAAVSGAIVARARAWS